MPHPGRSSQGNRENGLVHSSECTRVAYLCASHATTGPVEYTFRWILHVVPGDPITLDQLLLVPCFPKRPRSCGCSMDLTNLCSLAYACASDVKICTLQIALLNNRSPSNKTFVLSNFLMTKSQQLGFLFLTETVVSL